MENLQSAFGIFALLALAWIVSEDRRGVAWGQAAVALLVTFATAVILLKVPGATGVFAAINDAVDAIAAASRPAPPSFSAISAAVNFPTSSRCRGRNSCSRCRPCRSCW